MAFAIPVLGDSLHRAKTTAYDQAGWLDADADVMWMHMWMQM
jgi:hypothetical protein